MPTADLLFRGGSIFVGEGLPKRGLAVAIISGRVSAIIPEEQAASWIAETTMVVDLENGLLSPGFQDAHIHAISGGVELLQCNLTAAGSATETLATIAKYALDNPDVPWIVGGGWSMSHFPGGTPTRQQLDEVVSDRPVLLVNRDHHGSWANTAAITAAGIDAATPDPADGRIERESDGYPAGTFHEGAQDLFETARPSGDLELTYKGLLRAQEELLALGITGWQDAWVGADFMGMGDLREVYLRGAVAGTLKAHVVGAQWWDREGGLEQVADMVRRRDELVASGVTHRFSLGTTKIMIDGVAENHTASMLTPYRDARGNNTENHGISFIDQEVLKEAVAQLDAAGMQVHFHALGDRAVRDALDAVGGARQLNGATDCRHHLAHLQVVTEEDAERFAQVDAVANIQALWATHEDQLDELTLPFMQEGQEARQYPFGDLKRGGARFACGSDWPVSSADPIQAIQIAVTRSEPGSGYEPLGGEQQCLDLETALTAYTSGSAYVNHRDSDTGYIREGYLANLVVLEPDPFTLPESEIHTTKVVSTWIEGIQQYSRSISSK